nr:immunoglobulin heavy chain junction region [Mus musculus]
CARIPIYDGQYFDYW